MPSFTTLMNLIHKWVGLVAALWLAVLAVTGFFQANRNWEWQWSGGLPLPELAREHGANNDKQLWRHFQVDPANPDWRIVSGSAGAFASADSGTSWSQISFGDNRLKIVNALELIPGEALSVLAGTTDGVWRLDVARKKFEPVGLQGRNVTALASSAGGDLIAVVGRSKLLTARVDSSASLAWAPLAIGPPPEKVGGRLDLGRLLQDIHNGRGIFGGAVDMTVQNITALGLLFLALTGPLYWLLMRRSLTMRKRPKEQRPSKDAMQRDQSVIRWTFRTHSSLVGLVLALPLLATFLTGIYQDHRTDIQQMLRKIEVPGAILPPVYRIGNWSGQIYNVGKTTDGVLLIGTRMGVFGSSDNGGTWAREKGFIGPAMRMRRIGDAQVVPGRMMRRVQVREDGQWSTLDIPQGAVMANEMTLGPKGSMLFQRGEKIFAIGPDGSPKGVRPHEPPQLDYMPWGLVFETVHNGAIFHKQWKWVNDIAAIAGLLLVVTGFLRWLKRKW